MTKHIKDLVGKKFGRLLVISFSDIRGVSKHSYWLCKCECGKEKIVRGGHLKDNNVNSCGCLAKENSSKRLKEYASSNNHKGEGNPMWKGNKASHSSFHTWLSKNYIKPERCQKCKYIKRLDWALKRGKNHDHNVKNYLCLCRSCHLKYDYTPERRKFMGEMLTKARHNKRQKV